MQERRSPDTVADLGEFRLIERLASRLGRPRDDSIVGIGDDVAAIEAGPGKVLLATADSLVAGVHFTLGRCDPRRLGRKAAAVNISDVAAGGGEPCHLLVSLVLPPDTPVRFLESLYDGLAEETSRWGVDVVGGNVSRGGVLVIALTLLGETSAGRLIRRSGARLGDSVMVTGTLGGAAAGLHLVREGEPIVSDPRWRDAIEKHDSPIPRLLESRALVEQGGVHAMIDVSDGLEADVGHLCDASHVGVRIDAAHVPVDPAAAGLARSLDRDPLAWALAGGEDYELLFTAPPDRVPALSAAVSRAGGVPVTVIGDVVAEDDGRTVTEPDGGMRPLGPGGWRHF